MAAGPPRHNRALFTFFFLRPAMMAAAFGVAHFTPRAAGEHGTLRVSIYRPATAASAATRELKSGVMRGVASFGYHGSREPLPLAGRARHWMDLIARSR